MARPTEVSVKATPADEKRNQAILREARGAVSMNFANDTPLEDVKKYIEQSTQDEAAGLPTGIPIYVDPEGLKDAEQDDGLDGLASTWRASRSGPPSGSSSASSAWPTGSRTGCS